MSGSLFKVASFVLIVLGVFVYLGETMTRMSGGGAEIGSGAGGEISPEAGEGLFLGKAKCYTCHSVGDRGSAIRGPNLGDQGPLGMPVGLRAEERARERSATTGKTYGATDYLLESMIDPNAYVVEGYKAEMPVMTRPPIALDASAVQALVVYLLSLGGDPERAQVERSPFWERVVTASAEAATSEPFSLYLDGDVDAGRNLFFSGEATGCSRCHLVDGQGGHVGPELGAVAATRSVPFIIESIVNPGAQVASGFERTTVYLKDWNEVVGVKKAETGQSVEILDAEGELHRILRSDIDEIEVQPGSVMPANFADLLTVTEFHDLVAYVVTLKGTTTPAAEVADSGRQEELK